MSAKFVQLCTVQTPEGHTLYALDEEGNGWAYDGAARVWLALGRERLVPAAAVEPKSGGHRGNLQ